MSSLTTFSEETSRDLLICFLWLLKNVDPSILRHLWTQISREQLQNLIQLLDLSIATFEYKGKKQMKRHQRIGAGGQASLFQQISSCSSTKKPSIGTVKNQLEKSILGNENARTEMLNRNKQKNPLQSSHGSIFCLLFRKIFFLFFLLLFQNQRKVRIISDGEKIKRIGNKSTPNGTNEFSSKKKLIYFFLFKFRSEEEIQMDAHLESILACECTMIVLDTIETIIQVVQTTDCHQILLPGLLKILLHAFALNQSTWTLQNLFSHQRAIVYKVKSQKKIRRLSQLNFSFLNYYSKKIPNIVLIYVFVC